MQSVYSQTYCALDLETTGVNPYRDRIIEIGIVKFNPDSRSSDVYHSLVNPEKPVSEQSYQIHGISDEDLQDKPLYVNIASDVVDFIGNSFLIIQNPQFDLSFLNMAHKSLNLERINNYSFDTVTLSRKAFPFLENHKLDTISRFLSINRNFHRALDDALCCKDIFIRSLDIIDKERILRINALKELCGFDTRKKIFSKVNTNTHRGTVICPGEKYTIEYVDKEGGVTTRKIMPKNLYRTGSQVIVHAYCYLREEERCFNIKRIRAISLC